MSEPSVTAGTPAGAALTGAGPACQDGAGSAFVGGALGLLLALILAIAAVAATVIGLLVAIAALVTRLAPSRRRNGPSGPLLLEGRATAEGWVAERPSL